MRRIDKRKVALVVGILMMILGVVLMICGISNTVPEISNTVLSEIALVFCSLGLPFGGVFMLVGFGIIMDAVSMKPRKRAR